MKRRYFAAAGAGVGVVYAAGWVAFASAGAASSGAGILLIIAAIVGGLIGALAGGLGAVVAASMETDNGSQRVPASITAGFAAAGTGVMVGVMAVPYAGSAMIVPVGLPGAALALLMVGAFVWSRQSEARKQSAKALPHNDAPDPTA